MTAVFHRLCCQLCCQKESNGGGESNSARDFFRSPGCCFDCLFRLFTCEFCPILSSFVHLGEWFCPQFWYCWQIRIGGMILTPIYLIRSSKEVECLPFCVLNSSITLYGTFCSFSVQNRQDQVVELVHR